MNQEQNKAKPNKAKGPRRTTTLHAYTLIYFDAKFC